MNLKTIKASNTIDACKKLLTIQSGTGALVLITEPLYKEFKKVGANYDVSYKHWFSNMPTKSAIESFRVYDLHTLHCSVISLLNGCSWIAVLGIDSKEFSAANNNELYVVELA